jgi:hypothetical protein
MLDNFIIQMLGGRRVHCSPAPNRTKVDTEIQTVGERERGKGNKNSTVVFWSVIERVFGLRGDLTGTLPSSRLPKSRCLGWSAGERGLVRVGVWLPRWVCGVAPGSLSSRL